MSEYESIEYDVVDGRAEIFFNRPEVLNAFDKPTIEEFNDAVHRAMADDSAYIIVISGRGRGFCSGVDIKSEQVGPTDQSKAAVWDWVATIQQSRKTLLTGPTPSIAAINGPAIGGGMELALMCDLRVMSETAFMNDQHANIGLVPGLGTGWRFPQLVGLSKAMEYVLLGKDLSAETAAELGLVVDVVPDDELLVVARELADEIVNKPVRGIQTIKALVGADLPMDEHAKAFFQHRWECRSHPEHKEAIRALHAGENPQFDR